MLRKARRLDPESKDAAKLDADIAYVEAKLLIADGRPDRYLLERAVELDPDHAEARSLLAGFEEKALVKREASKRASPRWPWQAPLRSCWRHRSVGALASPEA
jgi:cytochrome c-type biogenesis protein CcmH/NrfG